MGAAGLFALLAGRPSSRLFALLAAAAATLALNPLASGDPGWQLSFAAVIGIFALAAPLRSRLGALLGPGRARGALAEGAAVTIAATLVTAPIGAHHFEAFSFAALPANLLVLPAVAPAMWLGMTVAALAQLPAAPIGPLNALNEALLGYIAQVAAWFGDPAWAQADIAAPSAPVAIGIAALLIAGTRWLLRAAERRSARRARDQVSDRRERSSVGAAERGSAAAAGATRRRPPPRVSRLRGAARRRGRARCPARDRPRRRPGRRDPAAARRRSARPRRHRAAGRGRRRRAPRARRGPARRRRRHPR